MSRTLRVSCKSIALLLILAGAALAQSPPESNPARKTVLGLPQPREIPEATLPCTPEEAKWWQDLRKAGKAVQETRGGRKERDKFLDLLQQGKDKSYQPPIPDSKAIVLNKVFPSYSQEARRKTISGNVKLSLNLRPDGFVGEVEILQGLGYGLDEKAADAARRSTFLPPVKDRKFTTIRLQMIMGFNVY